MLDVYRTYYGLTGEPFRLGPDHRFSLHHTSYANAKAYLEFAIYQGEGFIAITGGPGTGKTTLISEILANVDRDRVEVATLNSTQLESRDLLHMVASSFGLHPEKFNKADLLLEIESFLTREIRSGHRAILIVDEAQGLSSGALEELRQLANLQYKYQLLLQIVLVGQERLLELIHAPGMEHLQQRLVAATALEPLSFDETIDYIEHRLLRVGWKGDPSIAEPALRLIYRYSGGIPRRINLIANRLFLYGGMEEKHRLSGEDAHAVIDGLITEFLLTREPLVDEAAIKAQHADGGDKPKARRLPRRDPAKAADKPGPSGQPAQAGPAARRGPGGDRPQRGTGAGARSQGVRAGPSAGGDFKLDSEGLPGSRRPSAGTAGGPAAAPRGDERTVQRPLYGTRGAGHPQRPAATGVLRGRARQQKTTGGNKGVALVLLLLAGAGVAYLLEPGSMFDLQPVYSFFGRMTGVVPPAGEPAGLAANNVARVEVDPLSDREQGSDATRAEVGGELDPAPMRPDDAGNIIRADGQESGSTESAVDAPPDSDASVVTDLTDEPVATDAEESAAAGEVANEIAPPAVEDPARPDEASDAVEKTPAAPLAPSAQPEKSQRRDEEVPIKASGPPATQTVVQKPAKSAAPGKSADVDVQRSRLREDAEKRFSEQVAQITPGAGPVTAPSAAVKPAQQLAKAEPVAVEPAPERRPAVTAAEVKTILLKGRWSSSGKPASLLPSERTYCHAQVGNVTCVSVPQNVSTQYGPALYKVETTLSGFSASGHFEMSYRTLVRLTADSQGQQNDAASDPDGWQITEYSMSCELSGEDRVSCLDDKGIVRHYNRIGVASDS